MKTDGSYALADADEATRRQTLLASPHMTELRDFVRELRAQTGSEFKIPDFDPLDGGKRARVLFLMEAPGPKAVASGFVSRDNPDPTARNLKNFLQDAGIEREGCAVWNLVPWYIGNETGSKIRPATADDARQSAGALQRLWPMFPDLRARRVDGPQSAGRRAKHRRGDGTDGFPDVSHFQSGAPTSRHDQARFGENRAVFCEKVLRSKREIRCSRLNSSIFCKRSRVAKGRARSGSIG